MMLSNARPRTRGGCSDPAGTDTFGEQEAGATTIQEIELMVDAGMPTHDVVQASSREK